jgi:hypothetical protein
MAQIIEISYFNSFVVRGGTAHSSNNAPTAPNSAPGRYHIEESRIKGEFNGTQVDFGARAYATDDEYGIRRRSNAMMYSGIYNSKTKVNKTNEYPIGAAITRAVDIAHGSIQKLHAEETNLNILQENKASYALIDKDAIFTAEGGNLSVSGVKVIGQIVPYLGKYGISNNPESFVEYGGRKYFADVNRGVVLRLTRDGLTPISAAGMKDFFRDNFKQIRNSDKVYGMYDEVHDQYIVSLQNNNINVGRKTKTTSSEIETANTGFATVSFSEKSKGWVSVFSFKPTFGVSLKNQFFTFNNQFIFKHYDTSSEFNKFYDATYKDPSYVNLVMNDMPSSIKSFLTINYEGTTGWSMEQAEAENVYTDYGSQREYAYKIPKKGVTISDENGIQINVGFESKEGKYYKELRQNLPFLQENFTADFNRNTFNKTTGIKGYHAVFELQYHEPFQVVNEVKPELFAVGNEINISS